MVWVGGGLLKRVSYFFCNEPSLGQKSSILHLPRIDLLHHSQYPLSSTGLYQINSLPVQIGRRGETGQFNLKKTTRISLVSQSSWKTLRKELKGRQLMTEVVDMIEREIEGTDLCTCYIVQCSILLFLYIVLMLYCSIG